MTHFRKRFDAAYINTLNERMVQMQRESSSSEPSDTTDTPESDDQSKQSSPNQGKLMLDATCATADIQYPTDLRLLNTAREKLEAMIDTLHAPFVGQQAKPHTYRKKARRQYLAVAKQRRPGIATVRKGIHQQLGYVGRNLKHVTTLADRNGLAALSPRQYRYLLVIQELYRQQDKMFEEKTAGIDNRIVSIRQPHVHPIVRGKMNAPVEFGAKLSVSRYGLGRISACLQKTSETVIALNFLVMNIGKLLRDGFFTFQVNGHSLEKPMKWA